MKIRNFIVLSAMALIVITSTGCVSKSLGGNMIGSVIEKTISNAVYGDKMSEAVSGAALKVIRYNVDDVVEAGVEKATNYGLDEYDESKLISIGRYGQAHQTVSWENPYTRKSYKAVPKPARYRRGHVTRDVVVFLGYRKSITATVENTNAGWKVNI